jgi:hypothetical protein
VLAPISEWHYVGVRTTGSCSLSLTRTIIIKKKNVTIQTTRFTSALEDHTALGTYGRTVLTSNFKLRYYVVKGFTAELVIGTVKLVVPTMMTARNRMQPCISIVMLQASMGPVGCFHFHPSRDRFTSVKCGCWPVHWLFDLAQPKGRDRSIIGVTVLHLLLLVKLGEPCLVQL